MERSAHITACLARVALGDEASFETLFRLYKDRTYSIALVYTENREDAEDVVHDVFFRIWKYRARLTAIRDFNAWIVIVTKYRSLTVLKKKAKEYVQREALMKCLRFEINDAESSLLDKELQQMLHALLNRLPAQQRKIFELSRLQGLDRHTIAQKLRLSPSTVSVHLTNALKAIRLLLNQQGNVDLICLFLFLYIWE
ncbi:RNA polymerase sigma factor [Niabella aquatica]